MVFIDPSSVPSSFDPLTVDPLDPISDLADLFDPRFIEEEAAAYALYLADALPGEPEAVTSARAALSDLLDRNGGWDDLKRDDRRLVRHYQATIKAGTPDLVAHARGLGLLDSK